MAKKEKIVNKNYNLKIDLSIPSVDDSISMAKQYLDAIVLPPLAETGLLIKDYITGLRFANQVKIINWSKKLCDIAGIKPSKIALKLLTPLLENASLEEDEYLQEKWAFLLTNMVDSQQNVANHVVPYLLSQLSRQEYQYLDKTLKRKRAVDIILNLNLSLYEENRTKEIININNKINITQEIINTALLDNPVNQLKIDYYKGDIENFKSKLDKLSLENGKSAIYLELGASPYIQVQELEDFELGNLIRLGIIKEHARPSARFSDRYPSPSRTYHNGKPTDIIKVDLDLSNYYYSITQLGEKLIDACSDNNR